MIRRIQALNYRCLHYVDVDLDRFHVLVGPNAAGKSTLFDVVAFLSDFVSDGLGAAVEKRTRNFQDLVWGRPKTGLGFQLAVEFVIPAHVKKLLPKSSDFQLFRYEIEIEETRHGPRSHPKEDYCCTRAQDAEGGVSCSFRNIGRRPTASCKEGKGVNSGQYCDNVIKMDVHTELKYL